MYLVDVWMTRVDCTVAVKALITIRMLIIIIYVKLNTSTYNKIGINISDMILLQRNDVST